MQAVANYYLLIVHLLNCLSTVLFLINNFHMKKTNIVSVFIILSLIIISSCSTEKNTSSRRAYHNLTSHYNVYFNGYESFNAGLNKIDEQYKDNYTEILPIFRYADDQSTQLVSSDMDLAIEKSAKTITNHSIIVKPKIKDKRSSMTEKEKEFHKKNEFCKWIDDCYLLMGKANFYNQEYTRSTRAFRRILNLYKTENTRFEATLWLVKTYIAQKKFIDALTYLTELENDVRHPEKLDKEINLTFADLYIQQKDYLKAIIRLEAGIELTRKRKEKARYYFILAQLNYEIGNMTEASELYKKVIKMNPPYEMAFNAKINRATAFSSGQDASDIKKDLKKMLRDDKNEEFKDQIYYALANIEFAEGNEPEAIKYYRLSTQASVSNNNQKAISFLALADIFIVKPKYLLAGSYYDSTMQYLDVSYIDYATISKKAENLGELVVHLKEVQLQDSLQTVASWSEKKRNDYIDKLIKEIKEEEERLKEEEQNNYDNYDNNQNNNNQNNIQGGKWYFYNPTLVSRGQNKFKQKWGNRKLEDNWRRKNKAISNDFGDDDENKENVDSTLVTDNKDREFYLQHLPLNDSLMEISNQKIIDALFSAGEVYEKRINDYDAAIATYEDLNKRFPSHLYLLEVYYRLYKLCKKTGNNSRADYYKNQVITLYPDSKYAKILKDPNYINKLIAIEKSAVLLYETTFQKYKDEKYSEVIIDANTAITKYPESDTYPNFLYLKGASYGHLGNTDSLFLILKTIVEDYHNYEIAALAESVLIVIESGKFDTDIYNIEDNQAHFYVLYIKKRKDLNEIKFELSSHATDFSDSLRFQTVIQTFDNTHQLIVVKSFSNKGMCLLYYNSIISNFILTDVQAEDYEHFIISINNFDIFNEDKIIEKYMKFYRENYL